MTYVPATWECDRCFEPVDATKMITLVTTAGAWLGRDSYEPGYLGHYHLDCWHEIEDAVCDLPLEPVSDRDPLEAIPVASEAAINITRLRHRLPDGMRYGEATAELRKVLRQLAPKCAYALPRAGVRSLDDVARMTDEQLLSIKGVGHKTVEHLRNATRGRATNTGHTQPTGGQR